MFEAVDTMLQERAEKVYSELTSLYENSGGQDPEPRREGEDFHKRINNFESMLAHCKEGLPQEREVIAAELLTLYQYDVLAPSRYDLQKTAQSFCAKIFSDKKLDSAFDDLIFKQFHYDLKLIDSVILALQKRLEQMQAHTFLLLFHRRRPYLIQHRRSLEKFLLLREVVESSILTLHDEISAVITENFCYFYKFFSSIISYFETAPNLYVLVELSSMIDILKKRLLTPVKNGALKERHLSSNYAIAELSHLQQAILRLI